MRTMIEMKAVITKSVEDAIRAAQYLKLPYSISFMQKAATLIAEAFTHNQKLLIAGNGGSLCDAMHFAEEFTGQFRKKRKALPAIALSDPGHMSCTANDMGFSEVFSRGVEALGKKGDILILLTTSGNSENLYRAAIAAKEKEITLISFLGKKGGKLKGLSNLEWIVEGFSTSDRIQEAHMAAIHIIIEAVEEKLFYGSPTQPEVCEIT